MANEATVMSALRIVKDEVQYQSLPQSYNADVSVGRGPTPGLVLATVGGTLVDLSLLTQPGLCWIQNIDSTNWVELGMLDPVTQKFYPMIELLPGEFTTVRLARNIQEEYDTGTGTGTTGVGVNRLMVRANAQSCRVRIECFET